MTWRSWCLVLIAVLALAFLAAPVSAATITVCLGGGCDHTSIQAAINAASPGDTISVAAGTYNENITISKHVDIVGAGSSTSGTIIHQTPAGAGDSKIGVVQLVASGNSDADPILLQDLRIDADGMAGISVGRFTEATGTSVSYVKLDNVHVVGHNVNPNTEQERGLYVDLTSSLLHLVVVDCAFDNLTYGWYLQKQVSADASTVQYVDVTRTTFNHNNLKGLYAEKLSDAAFTNCVVDQNGFSSAGVPTYFLPWMSGFDINLKAGSYSNLSFVDCTFTDNALGGAQEGVGLTVKGRDDGGTYGPFPATVSNVLVDGCVVTGNERGIRFGEPGKLNAGPTNVTVQNCSIEGNVQTYGGSDGTAYGGLVDMTVATNTIDAENNWWGAADGPAPAGSGDAVYGNVDYDPFLTSPFDVYVNAASGDDFFGTGSASSPFATITKGVAEAAAGVTVHVAAGTYNEGPQIVIDKDLAVDGAGMGVTTVTPTGDTGSSGDARGWFLVDAGVAFDLSNLTLDGTGHLIYQGVRHKGGGTVDQVEFKGIKYNESGPHYSGVAVAAFGDDVDFTDCSFSEIGRVGVLYFGTGITGSTFDNNIYTGKGAGDWLDYALDISAGAVVTASNNTISGNLGVASSDGSTSAGILVSTYYGAGTQATIAGNTLTGNTTGVAVGYDGSDSSSVVVNFNNITGNTSHGVSSTAPSVDVEGNWWGDASGPSGDGPGSGDAVDAQGDYSPWLGKPVGSSPMTWYVDTSSDAADVQGLFDTASAGDTIIFTAGTYTPSGGYDVDQPGLTIILEDGVVIQPSSPCWTVSEDNTTIVGGVCEPDAGSNGVETGAAVSGLTVKEMEIYKAGSKTTADGIHIGHDVTNLRIVDCYLHDLDGDGLEYGSGTTVSGVHEVQGNLFQNNTGDGVKNSSANSYVVEYNSWGHYDGPNPSGDGASGTLDFTPWTHILVSSQSSGSLQPDKVRVGYDIDITVQAEAREAWGADFDMAFDKSLLQVMSIVDLGSFDQHPPGACAISTPAEANASGIISFCGNSLAAVNGASAGIYKVTFRGLAAGTSGLDLDDTTDAFAMAPPSGASTNIYAHDLVDGQITVYAVDGVTGRIDLQGRTDDTGAQMAFGLGYSYGYGPYAFSASDYWGAVSVSDVVWDEYDITVTMERYLDVTLSSLKSKEITGPTALADLVLWGGDANGDDAIDIGDAGILGGAYGTSPPSVANADINADNAVNILDLVLVGGNFSKESATAYASWSP
jgi:hypothetical protein